MAVTDRWHRSRPDPEEHEQCEHRIDGQPLYKSTEHMVGKRWQVRYRDADGKQCSRNFAKKTGKNPAVHAEAFDAKVNSDLNAGNYLDPKLGDVTLAAFAKVWRERQTGDPNTLANIDDRLLRIIDVPVPEGARTRRKSGTSIIASKTMRQLEKDPGLIQDWVKSLENCGLKPGTIKVTLGLLSTIFRAAIVGGVIHRNPTKVKEIVKPPPVVRERVIPWTLEQVRASGKSLGGRCATIPEIGAGAGMRSGEIFGFSEDEIDWSGQEINVLHQIRLVGGQPVFSLPKRGKQRSVPMSDWVMLLLQDQIEKFPPVPVTLPWMTPDGEMRTYRLLYVRKDGRARHRAEFSHHWGNARRAAGVPETPENGVHVLRHTYASVNLSAGVDIRTLAEWLGHSNPGFTLRIYAHLMPSAAGKGRVAVDTFFTENSEVSALKVPSAPK